MDLIGERILLLDRMNEVGHADPLYSFALDELLCRQAGRAGPAICHIWRHPQAFIMGLRDSRLPFAADAARWLDSNGWPVIVRNSGGAAVPLDAGVVNVSLILPLDQSRPAHFHNEFESMAELVREALRGTGVHVEKGLVEGAYCPGDYDLSIDGYKFCGIAQRRQVNAVIIQAFVVAEGSGRMRAEFVRSFYEIASGGNDSLGHPIVTGDSTASLEELTGLGGPAGFAFAAAVKEVIRRGDAPSVAPSASDSPALPATAEVEAMIAVLRARYAISWTP